MSHPAANHFHLAANELAFAGPGDRFGKNLAALQLVDELEAAGRPATDEERQVLAHYTAFGESALLNRLFRFGHAAGRYALHDSYAALLSSDDARHLRVSALTGVGLSRCEDGEPHRLARLAEHMTSPFYPMLETFSAAMSTSTRTWLRPPNQG